jgi:serine/threonine-protein kinase
MGVVVAARHIELGELFAIKLPLPGAVDSPLAISRFLREARAAVRLTSEHVARVHDVGRLEDGLPYMVMEHLSGRDLAAILQSGGALPLQEAATLVLQACDAIAEAHALGIIHRDLKLSNLFLTRGGNDKPCLKVLDFGISKQADAREQLTRSGAVIGSPLYMSPEQIQDPKTVDTRTDIWAMGIVLYELATGYAPFEGDGLHHLILHVLHTVPDPPSRVRPELPAALDSVVMRCLRKNPGERYDTIEEFAAAVRSFAGSSSDHSLPIAMQRLALPAAAQSDAEAEAVTVPIQ